MGWLAFFIGSKLRAIATSIAAVLLVPAVIWGAVQTVRIDGALCRAAKPSDKPECVLMGFRQRIEVVRIDLDQVRQLRAADQRNWQSGYDAATAIAQHDKEVREAEFAAIKERANNDLSQARTAARAAADRYARAHRVLDPAKGSAPADGPAGAADLPGGAVPAVVADGPGADAGLVAVPRALFDTLIDNTLRLQNGHDWATGPAFSKRPTAPLLEASAPRPGGK